jgi:hypothetical protein
MRYLRTNTAVNVTIGPFLDYADGLTPKDTLTVTGITGVLAYDDDDGTVGGHADFTCSASGGDNDLVAVGHNGLWTLELTAAQVNHLGRAILSLTAPTQICPVFHEFQILAANVYDSLFAGVGPTPDLLDVNAEQHHGTAQTAGRDLATVLPEVAAGAEGGLPVLPASLKLPATVAEGDGADAALIKAVTDKLDTMIEEVP